MPKIDIAEQMKNLLVALVRVATRYHWLVIALALMTALWSILHTSNYLKFQTGRNDLVDPGKKYIQLYEHLPDEFDGIGQHMIVVEAPTAKQAQSYVLELGALLEAQHTLYEEVFYRVDTRSLEGKKLLFLSLIDLLRLKNDIEKYQDFFVRFCRQPGLNMLFSLINEKVSGALAGHLVSGFLGSEDEKSVETLDLGFIQRLLYEMTMALNAQGHYRSFWSELFGNDMSDEESLYLKTENGKFYFIMLKIKDQDQQFVGNVDATMMIRNLISRMRITYPDVDVGLTGSPALNDDEMISVKKDTFMASLIALFGVALLFWYSFRALKRPFLVILSLLVGVSWTMGFLTITVGHLNVLSVAFTPILIGLGIDFGIHILARYEEERAKGNEFQQSLDMTFFHSVPSVIAGALTTAIAFYSMLGVQFRGIRELGFIAGSGILLTLLAMLIILPALLRAVDYKHHGPMAAIWKRTRLQVIENIFRFPTVLGLGAILITLLALILSFDISFDYNILHLQARGTESVIWEKKLLKESERSSWFALSVAPSQKVLKKRVKAFSQLKSVHKVESVLSIIPQHQREKIDVINAIKPILNAIRFPLPQTQPVDEVQLQKDLVRLKFKMGKVEKNIDKISPEDQQRLEIRGLIDDLLIRLAVPLPEKELESLRQFASALIEDFQGKLEDLFQNLDPQRVRISDLPESILRRFVSEKGNYLIRVYAKDDIWERKNMLRFVKDLRRVDPDVTGPPVVGSEAIYLMKRGYEKGAEYALIAVAIVILLLFRNVALAFFAMIPLFVGGLWLFAVMVLWEIQFNLANIIVIPLLIGISVDNGIHIIKRACENNENSGPIVAQSTGKAVVLSSLTTMIGFGSLMIADHYGIFSLGLVLTLGIGCVLTISILVLPLVLKIYFSKKQRHC
ncbi:MAG: MMPL family transporter [Chlamydiota bacterium]|nr:MMPL family transporter [Chlamydiota bacterium]